MEINSQFWEGKVKESQMGNGASFSIDDESYREVSSSSPCSLVTKGEVSDFLNTIFEIMIPGGWKYKT